MKIFVANTPIGLMIFDEKEMMIYFEQYKPDIKFTINKYLKKSEVPDKFRHQEAEINTDKCYKIARKHIRIIGRKIFGNDEKYNMFIRDFCIELSKRRMKIDKDKLVIRAVGAWIDANKLLNVFYQRIKEWYILHYPELDIEQKKLTDIILQFGNRVNVPEFKESVGIELEKEDVDILKGFARLIKELEKFKRDLEMYIKELMKEIAPNISTIIDPILGARIISSAGSLEKLSRLASSSIQLLGAEKALFRHLRKKTKPPKYGLLYLDHRVQNAPKEKRGRIARLIASKLSIAARIDFYSKQLNPRLKKELKDELKKVLV